MLGLAVPTCRGKISCQILCQAYQKERNDIPTHFNADSLHSINTMGVLQLNVQSMHVCVCVCVQQLKIMQKIVFFDSQSEVIEQKLTI